jgi:hypothetical protein
LAVQGSGSFSRDFSRFFSGVTLAATSIMAFLRSGRSALRLGLVLQLLATVAEVAACGSSSSTGAVDASAPGPTTNDASMTGDGDADDAADAAATDSDTPDSSSDAGSDAQPVYDGATVEAGALTACRTTGTGAFSVPGTTCFNLTPVDVGEPAAGVNATAQQYAIRPGTTAAAPTTLLLFLIGSGGEPVDALRPGPAENVYGAAVTGGNAVLGLAYDNTQSINDDCGDTDACYFATRQSVILGTTEPGSALTVTADEGIVDRTARTLRYLAASDPSGGWGAFLTTLDPAAPATQAIAWGNVIVSGHSQGGGHAAAIGKLFAVKRVVQLSSTCDAVHGVPASWTDGSTGTWVTAPHGFLGFAAPTTITAGGATGDTTCTFHAAIWANLGMAAANRMDDAATCGVTGDTHGQSLTCVDNYPAWVQLYE